MPDYSGRLHFSSVALAAAFDLDLHFPCEAVSRERQARKGVDTMSTPLLQGRSEMSWMAISKRLLPANNGRLPATNACRKAAIPVRFNAGIKRRAARASA
jgi:hypothetical protein